MSVTSLLSSILGAIPSEITEKLTNSTRSEFSGGGEYKTTTTKANIGAKREITRTTDYQVLRKASIQATFRDLYANVESSLALRSGPLPEFKSRERRDIRDAMAGNSEVSPWIIDAVNLERGQLLELEVELRADAIFRTSTIISSVTNIIDQSPILSAEADTQEMRSAIELNGFIREMMAGLVPIRCKVLDYEVANLGGRDFIIHSQLLSGIPASNMPVRKPLHLVGVVEEALFWKDIRRVLFSNSSVRILCRVAKGQVQESWSPVKLVDVLREVIPDMESVMGDFGPSALRALTGGAENNRDASQLRHAALVRYAELLAEVRGSAMTDSLRSQVERIADFRAPTMGSVSSNRAAFREVTELISNELSVRLPPDTLAEMRAQALSQHGLMIDGSLSVRPDDPSGRLDDLGSANFIDAEIVAIYW
ncbi:hypothetical protein MRQ86_29385 [Streptomyces sp. MMS21 TC-5]|uniref:DUF6414 family protein n=1 Tax=Streptomyces sp. MMS21 TC-5 TaxID=2925833 RepID=UPI001F61B3C9|nr:hypothetical protein [Streptomyces sp. MMS21 TC-5]MCI4084350.1 hypothetical protein [Streptomyces sp. MMS21 TC-5]